MTKKSSASSQHAKLKSMRSEDIFKKPLTEQEKAILQRHADRQAAVDDSNISLNDIPALTEDQLARMMRPLIKKPKISVSVRLNADVLEWLKGKGEGHLTRINDILTNVMEAERNSWR